MKNVLIIGGGASGLMAAIAAAEAGASVQILEAGRKAGSKILKSGNGRCNLSNTDGFDTAYRGRDPEFAAQVLKAMPPESVLMKFREMGLMTFTEEDRIYPRNQEASAVFGLLQRELSRLHVRIRQNEEAVSASYENGQFAVKTQSWSYPADALILACGSPASLRGNIPAGISLAEAFGHRSAPFVPDLTGLTFSGSDVPDENVRFTGRVRLLEDGLVTAEEEGNLQFTARGISGIPVMNLSGRALAAIKEGRKTVLSLDFIPEYAEYEPSYADDPYLASAIPSRLLPYVQKHIGDGGRSSVHDFRLEIRGSFGMEAAQAASGGILTDGIDPCTMMSRMRNGLFITGEMLDICGKCGGYNLQFAWSTGLLAGRFAALCASCNAGMNSVE